MTPYVQDPDFTLYLGEVSHILRQLPNESVDCVITSPPYLDARSDYRHLSDPRVYAEWFGTLAGQLARVAKQEAPFLLNVGRVFRDGVESDWWIRAHRGVQRHWAWLDTRIWVKPNANPIHGPIFANSHEYVFVYGTPTITRLYPDAIRTEYDQESLARFQRRYRNQTGVKGEVREQEGREANEAGARARSFYIAYVGREKGIKHPCPMPEELAAELVLLGSAPGDLVLDPFGGSGTTALAARKLGRRSLLIEEVGAYAEEAAERLAQQPLLAENVA